MHAPSLVAVAVLGWFAFTAEGAALTAVATILFVLALLWAIAVTSDGWQVLRRFARRAGRPPDA
jgi:hypothetical protein